ncbi:hypothetical protein [Salinithrix halophila]|uniref:YmzC-like protein n=1 Tax=Salinithrix halophila TaxID=1485204 RepID=A0ABV8JPZ1_9BACL
MGESVKNGWVQVLLGTVVAVNLMLGGLLVARQLVVLPQAVPATGKSAEPSLRTETQLEWEGTSTEGNWRIDHYRKIDVQIDDKGKIVDRQPSSEWTHIRYWNKDIP